MVRRPSSLFSLFCTAATSLALLVPGAARADTSSPAYHSATIVTSGVAYGKFVIPANDDLFVAGLSDGGEIVFSAGNASGSRPERLMKWTTDSGALIPIVMPPTGPASASTEPIFWPQDVTIDRPVSVNQHGRVLFSADHTGLGRPWGTFLWKGTNQITTVALKGMPATGNLIFTAPGGFAPALNNADEMALVAQVKDTTGPVGYGLFFLGRDGVLQPVLLPNQALPGGDSRNQALTDAYLMPSINDAGAIAFLTRSHASSRYSAYMWEYGTVIPLITAGTEIPGEGKVIEVSSVFVNNKSRNVFVTATTDRWGSGRHGIYNVLDGVIRTILAPGQTMPGGSALRTVQYAYTQEFSPPLMGVSNANAAGKHAFVATLEDGSTGVYQTDSRGSIALISKISKIGTPPPVTIADVTPSLKLVLGARPCLNNKGQVALSVRTAGGPSSIVLLTPMK
jgi:hypothetical protein